MYNVITRLMSNMRRYVAVVLMIVWVASVIHAPQMRNIVIPLLVIVAGLVFDILIYRWRGLRKAPWSALVTSLLVSLILPLNVGVFPLLMAVVIALASKQLRWGGRHIFNPTALGILAGGILLNVPAAWWAVSWSWWPAAIVVIGLVPLLFRLRRLWLSVGFYVIYSSWLVISTGSVRIVPHTFTDGTVLLFSLVMLTEPMTSPATGKWKFGFGVLVGALVVVLNFWVRMTARPIDLLLAGLLVGDALFFLTRSRRPRPMIPVLAVKP